MFRTDSAALREWDEQRLPARIKGDGDSAASPVRVQINVLRLILLQVKAGINHERSQRVFLLHASFEAWQTMHYITVYSWA